MTTLQLIKAASVVLAEQHDTKFCKTWRKKRDEVEKELKTVAFKKFREMIAKLPENHYEREFKLANEPWFFCDEHTTGFRLPTKELAPELIKKLKKLVSPNHRNAYCFEQELRRLVALKFITRKQLEDLL